MRDTLSSHSPGAAPVLARESTGRLWVVKLRLPLLFIGYLSLAIALQWMAGAYTSDFGPYPDEAAHFVTGLMLREYAREGFPTGPVAFAERYYLFYPWMGLGHWPPVFYILEAAWLLVFPVGRTSVMVLMATLCAIAAVMVAEYGRKRLGEGYGAAAGLLFIVLPVVQSVTSVVMADLPTAAFMFAALLRFGLYLQHGRWQDSLWFGVWSSTAILTKGNAWSLALVPALAVMLSGQIRRAATFGFWLSALAVIAICGPYHVLTWKMIYHGWPSDPSNLRSILYSLPTISGWLGRSLGGPVAVLAVIGFAERVVAPLVERRKVDGEWATLAAFVPVFVLFHAAVLHEIAEFRYFVMIAPVLVLFAMAGMRWLLRTKPLAGSPGWRPAVVSAIVAALFLLFTFQVPTRYAHGFRQLVGTLVSRPDFRPETLLVASSAHGEGMFIAEVAALSPKPQRIVLRASKHVYSSAWAGNNYQLRYAKTEDLATALADIPVHALVIHREAGWPVPPHLEQLERMIAERPGDWRRIHSASQAMPLGREEFDVYRFTGRRRQGRPQFKVDLTDKLNRSLNF